jgi:hypothetical protein
LPSGRVASDQVQLTPLTTYTPCGKRKRDAHQKTRTRRH